MILAAGYGTRLRPLTEHLPKPLLPVLGRPVLWHQARLLADAGVKEAVINLHHLPERIEEYVGSGALGFLATHFVREEGRILGTGGGIRNARGFLGPKTALVVNGDTLLLADLAALVGHHRKSGATATMLLIEDPSVADEHAVYVDGGGRVRRAVGHGAPARGLLRCAFLGAHAIEPAAIDYLPQEGCVIRNGYVKAMGNGEPIAGFVTRAQARDLGTPASLLQTNLDALHGELDMPHVKESLSDNKLDSRHKDPVKVRGMVFVGPGCAFGTGVELGPDAVLACNVRVGKGARIAQSLVLHGETIKPGEVLTHTVAGFGLRIRA
ncbi:MAG: NDP-sugar synthase [Deltaproteobacteria bacterium]|nr:NDP-sugar synthase [Deltaproteobacteria bacterium]